MFSIRRTLTLLAVLLGLSKLCACSAALDTQVGQRPGDPGCCQMQ